MKKIAILFGGRSPEYAVSLASAAAVLAALDPKKYEPIPIGITRAGAWLVAPRATPDEIARDAWEQGGLPCQLSHDPTRGGVFCRGGSRFLPALILSLLHGGAGEDGRVQGLLSLSGIPFLGTETEGSALSMNKAVAKLLARDAGVPTLPHILYHGDLARAKAGAAALGYPVFVKPTHGGSSLGAGVAQDASALEGALAHATAEGDSALVEPFVRARELEVAILDTGKELLVSEVGEIRTASAFYDYETKYESGRATLEIARISEIQNTRVRTYAEKVYRALGLRHLARVDFFLSERDGGIYFNEVNTLPGFTAGSMFPFLLAGGGGLSSLLERLIEGALSR